MENQSRIAPKPIVNVIFLTIVITRLEASLQQAAGYSGVGELKNRGVPRLGMNGQIGPGLLAGDLFPAMFTDIGTFFDDFRTEWTFPCERPLMDLFYGVVYLLSKYLVAEFAVSHRLNRVDCTEIPQHFRCFDTDPHRLRGVQQHSQHLWPVFLDVTDGKDRKPFFDRCL